MSSRLKNLLCTSVALAAMFQGRIAAFADDTAGAPREGVYSVTEPLDMEMVKRHGNFGYTDEEIQKYFSYPEVYQYDATGMAPGVIKPAPAPGVHPRVFFHPDDLPALRTKLTETGPAQFQMEGIRAMLKRDLTGPDAKNRELYDAAARGEKSPGLTDVGVACPIIYETFRCLIDEDHEGAKKAAAALTTLAQMDDADLDKDFAKEDAANARGKGEVAIRPPLRDAQTNAGDTQHGLLGLGYDFAFNDMTDEQRDIVRGVIAKAQTNMTLLDAESLPAFPANTSNWIPMHLRLVLLPASIEGEKGYDAGTFHRCVQGYKRYLSVGFFPAGDMYESMGKNFLLAEDLIPIADHGENLLALKQIRAQIGSYYVHAMDPWGGHFTFYDSLGGRGNTTPMFDAVVLKHVFPSDPSIDFVYRNTVGEDYSTLKAPVHFGHPFHLLDALVQAIFAEKYLPGTWGQSRDAATKDKPLTFFSNDTGNLITRTAWTSDTLQLFFLARSVSGGHQYADRGHFSIHALGRYWAIYKPLRQVEQHYSPKNRSVVLIDGEGPGMTMGRVAAMEDKPQATFMVADETSAYNWGSGGNNRFPRGGVRVTATANDFRLIKSDLPWMNLAWSDLPFWQTSHKGAENWIPRSPVQRAFRTAGLVRGNHPYVLVVDDIQKDTASHQYQWGMTIEDDLVKASTVNDRDGSNFRDDLVLGEAKPAATGPARFMLLRVLNAQGSDSVATPECETYTMPNPPQRDIIMHRVIINAQAIAPDFKTLLFPYRQGDEQPVTSWTADHTQLKVSWSDQKDEVEFTKKQDGSTQIRITRNGAEIVALQ